MGNVSTSALFTCVISAVSTGVAAVTSPEAASRVYGGMGYIIAVVVVLLVLPLLFMLLSRRTRAGGGMSGKLHRGEVTVIQPSSDEPTPRVEQDVRDVQSGRDSRVPPG